MSPTGSPTRRVGRIEWMGSGRWSGAGGGIGEREGKWVVRGSRCM